MTYHIISRPAEQRFDVMFGDSVEASCTSLLDALDHLLFLQDLWLDKYPGIPFPSEYPSLSRGFVLAEPDGYHVYRAEGTEVAPICATWPADGARI